MNQRTQASAAPTYVGTCCACKRTIRLTVTVDQFGRERLGGAALNTRTLNNGKSAPQVFTCRFFGGDCTQNFEMKRIKHVEKPTQTKCGGACRSARGTTCDCECGGAHHAEAHA